MLYRVGNIPYTKPTLNLPDSVNKCKTDIKNVFVDATVPFQLLYVQIWIALSNRDYTGFEPELLASEVCLRTPWATEQTYHLRKPIDTRLDMCDANVQKHPFSNLPAF